MVFLRTAPLSPHAGRRHTRTLELVNRFRLEEPLTLAAAEPATLAAAAPQALTLGDRCEIEALIAEYAWLVDHGRWAEVAALCTPDAVLTLGRTVVTGEEGIVAWGERCAANGPRHTLHQTTNLRFTADGADRVSGTAAVVVHAVKDGRRQTFVDSVGEFHDEFVRTTAGWRFGRRRFVALDDVQDL